MHPLRRSHAVVSFWQSFGARRLAYGGPFAVGEDPLLDQLVATTRTHAAARIRATRLTNANGPLVE